VAEISRISRKYPITLGRPEGQGRRSKPLTPDEALQYRNHKLVS
jgi:type I restriction enzyme R subunit